MKFNKVKIKDVVNLVNGYSFTPQDREDMGYKIIRIQNLNNPLALYNKTTKEVPEKYFVEFGDILIAWSASLGVYEWKNNEKALLNQHIFKVEFNTNNLNKSYFKYVIELAFKELEYKMRGVGLKHLTKGQLDNYEFVLPPLDEQKNRANILNQIQDLINKRIKTIELLDEYKKSVFLDMFGDPVLNNKKWDLKNIQDIVMNEPNSIRRGPFGGNLKKQDFVDEGFLVYEQYHALNNDFSFERYFINENKFQELKNFKVSSRDLIISCSGINLGKLAIIPQNYKEGVINQALLKISLDEKIIVPEFFIELFTNPNFKKRYLAKRGVGVPNFPPISEFRKFNFIVPPLNTQKKFLSIIEQIKEQKEQNQKSLELLEELFQSVLYQTFNKKQEIQEDEIDKLINDELEIDILLADIKSPEMFDTFTQYDISKKKLFNVLERTELKSKEAEEKGKSFTKGLIQTMKNGKIEINYNQSFKPIKDEIS